MFAFYDLPPGRYMTYVESVIGERTYIWSAAIELKGNDSEMLDFGESNAGETERVYALAQTSTGYSESQNEGPPAQRQYTGYELADLGVAASQRGDNDEAYRNFAEGAKSGHAICQYNLGECYVYGVGVDRDYQTAAYWYDQAAQQGHARAQTKLGLCYLHGEGIAKNTSTAIYWFKKAAEQGDEEAVLVLNELLYEDSKKRGAHKSPPDRDAAEQFLTYGADTLVKAKIGSGELVDARRLGFQLEYVRGQSDCDAKAQVDYEFTFYTQAGTLRKNVGYLYFYHDPQRKDWFNSDTNIDGLPRY